jgi:hypothetical protein
MQTECVCIHPLPLYGIAVYGQMAGTDTTVPIQQSPTEASSFTLLTYDYADPLMQAAIRRVTFRVGDRGRPAVP